jgi:putative ABC transport system permease protein
MLFVQSFKNLQTSAVGFDTAPLLTLRFYLMGDSYEAPDARARRVEDIVRRVEAVPGIERAFGSNLIPLWSGGGGGRVEIDGRAAPPGEEPSIAFAGVTPGFHRTLGVAMAEGRDFTDAEGWSAERVAIVNRTMADRFWPGRSALGGRFRLLDSTGPQDVFTVIGVAPDVKHDDIDAEDESFPSAYAPYRFQQTVSTGLVIRVAGDPVSVSSAVREAIRASDPMIPVAQVRTMDELRELGYWEYGLFGWIFGVTGIVGLLLASVGVYGVLSYAVSQRTAEIGVRVALGAAHPDVLRLVVGHGLALSGAGVVVGLVLAPIGTRFGQTLFFNVSPFDPATFASVALFLLAVATVASYVPARRALRVDPVAALRGE